VHPLDRLLHFTKRSGKYTPIASIDYLRTRAAETGECLGISDADFAGAPGQRGFSAKVTVARVVGGQRAEFTATAYWEEYVPGQGQDFMWRKMPHVMLGKVAEALALRKGFPAQLAGVYSPEELDQADPSTSSTPRRSSIPSFSSSTTTTSSPGAGPSSASSTPSISPAQRRRLFAIAKGAGWNEEQIRGYLFERFGVRKTGEIPIDAYDSVCDVFGQAPPAAAADVPADAVDATPTPGTVTITTVSKDRGGKTWSILTSAGEMLSTSKNMLAAQAERYREKKTPVVVRGDGSADNVLLELVDPTTDPY
jgi:hypothetical protein